MPPIYCLFLKIFWINLWTVHDGKTRLYRKNQIQIPEGTAGWTVSWASLVKLCDNCLSCSSQELQELMLASIKHTCWSATGVSVRVWGGGGWRGDGFTQRRFKREMCGMKNHVVKNVI